MSALWPVFAIILFVWLLTRSERRRRYPRGWEPNPRDEEIARLKERVRALEEIITGEDWRLRRDFDGL
jgi:cytochrome c-type biogenesis protein CcmH/NrfF